MLMWHPSRDSVIAIVEACSGDCRVRILDFTAAHHLTILGGRRPKGDFPFQLAAWAPDDQLLAYLWGFTPPTMSKKVEVTVMCTRTGTSLLVIHTELWLIGEPCIDISLSVMLAVASDNRKDDVRVCNVASGREVFADKPGDYHHLAWSPDGKVLALYYPMIRCSGYSGYGPVLTMYDASSWTQLLVHADIHVLTYLGWSPTGTSMVCANGRDSICGRYMQLINLVFRLCGSVSSSSSCLVIMVSAHRRPA